jgi:thioesterase domain-containing protein
MGEALTAKGTVRPLVTPAPELEARIGALWRRIRPDLARVTSDTYLLDTACKGRDLVELIDRIAREFRIEVVAAELAAARTVAGTASLVRMRLRGRGRAPILIQLKSGGNATPILFMTGSDGTFARMYEITRRLPAAHPCYGFESPGARRGERPRRTIRSLARRYAEEIRGAFGGDPVILVAFCLGGVVAHELTHQLETLATPPRLLIFGDTPCPTLTRITRPWSKRRYWRWRRVRELTGWLSLYGTRGLEGRIYQNRLTYSAAAFAHRPTPIETEVVLLTSDEYRGRFGHADLGWTAFTRGGLTLVEIAEKHADVLRFQSVPVMAAIQEQLACRAL